jgi:hypothetical protein
VTAGIGVACRMEFAPHMRPAEQSDDIVDCNQLVVMGQSIGHPLADEVPGHVAGMPPTAIFSEW